MTRQCESGAQRLYVSTGDQELIRNKRLKWLATIPSIDLERQQITISRHITRREEHRVAYEPCTPRLILQFLSSEEQLLTWQAREIWKESQSNITPNGEKSFQTVHAVALHMAAPHLPVPINTTLASPCRKDTK